MRSVLFGVLLSLLALLFPAQFILAWRDLPPGEQPPPVNTAQILTGFAWAPTIGWISFDNNGYPGPAYGVTLTGRYDFPNNNNGLRALSGYAWNSNIGWIKFDPDLTGPDGTDPAGTTLRIGDGAVLGWARACAVFQSSGCAGDLKPDSTLGSWDGWIAFSWVNSSGDAYSVKVNNGHAPSRFLGDGTNFAWGGKGIGWISFCNPNGDGDRYCVLFGGLSLSCQVSPPPGSDGAVDVSREPHIATWTVTVRPDSIPDSPYSYKWTDKNGALFGDPNPLGGDPNPYSGYPAPLPPSFINPYSFSTSKDYSGNCPDAEHQDYTFTHTEPITARVNVPGPEGFWDCTVTSTIKCGFSTILPTGGSLSDPSSATITITSQSLASPAISSGTKLDNTSSASGDNATVSIQSSNSVLPGGPSLANTPAVKCRLAISALPNPLPADPLELENLFSGCDGGNSVPVSPGDSLFLNILVKGLAPPTLNQYNPYKIVLVNSTFCTPDPGPPPTCPLTPQTQNVFFDYAVGTVNPI